MCLRKAALRSLIILSLMPTATMSAFADDAQSLLQKGFSARDVWSVEPQLMLKANVKFVNLKSGDIEATYMDVTANQKHRREFSSDVYSEKSGSNETAFWYLHSSPEKPLQVLGLESALAELH